MNKIKSFMMRHIRICIILGLVFTILILLFIAVVNNIISKDVFWATFLGAIFGFTVSILVFEIALTIENKLKIAAKKEELNKIFRFLLMEIKENVTHMQDTTKFAIPHFDLNIDTKKAIWDDFLKLEEDEGLIKAINVLYSEYKLINNKLEILKALYLAIVSSKEKNKLLEESFAMNRSGLDKLISTAGRLSNESIELINKKLDNRKES